MANDIAVYTVIHQPRRLKLPAQPIPKNATVEDIERCLFDERMNERYFEKVATWCYYPATQMFLELVNNNNFKMSIGFSESFLRQARTWDTNLFNLFKQLVAHKNVEPVCVEPYHSFIPLIDLPQFKDRMEWARLNIEQTFGKKPVITDTTEMIMSDGIYHALYSLDFKAALMDGRSWVLGWRDATHLYHQGKDMALLTRHYELSDDVGYRFSNQGWWGYPLMANEYAHWLHEARGDFVFLAWDYETFGEHHSKDTGIFEFMYRFPVELSKQKMKVRTPSEIIKKYRKYSHDLPLSPYPCTWAGEGGIEFFLGNDAQQSVFQLMLHAYNKALLTENPELIDLALWLVQSDNLHLIQWFGRSGSDAEVSAYFTPNEWWQLGPNGIIGEMQQVFKNFIQSLDAYL